MQTSRVLPPRAIYLKAKQPLPSCICLMIAEWHETQSYRNRKSPSFVMLCVYTHSPFLVISLPTMTTAPIKILNSSSCRTRYATWSPFQDLNMEMYQPQSLPIYSELSSSSFTAMPTAHPYSAPTKALSRSLRQVPRLSKSRSGERQKLEFMEPNNPVQATQPRLQGRPSDNHHPKTTNPVQPPPSPNISLPQCTRAGRQIQHPRYISVLEGVV